jgi:hypothetical protein
MTYHISVVPTARGMAAHRAMQDAPLSRSSDHGPAASKKAHLQTPASFEPVRCRVSPEKGKLSEIVTEFGGALREILCVIDGGTVPTV